MIGSVPLAVTLQDPAAGGAGTRPKIPLRPTQLTISQDEGVAPYRTAQLTVVMPDAATYAKLAPAAGCFVVISVDPRQSFALRILERRRDAFGGVQLALASGEQALMDYTPSAVDRSAWTKQADAVSIVTGVLDAVFGGRDTWQRVFYTSAAVVGGNIGTPTYFTYSAASNLLPNGGFENGTAGWTATNCTITADTAWSATGRYALRLFPNTSSTNSYAYADVSVQAGTTYTLSAWGRTGGAGSGSIDAAARRMLVTCSVGGTGLELARSVALDTGSGSITSYRSVTFKTPASIDNGTIRVRLYSGQTSTGYAAVLWDNVLLVEGDGTDTDGRTAIPYFDGDTTDGTAGYNYDWQGAQGNSPSTRSPIVERDPETLTWSPGQSAWDFLQPILRTIGVRVWSTGYNDLASLQPLFGFVTDEFGTTSNVNFVSQGRNLIDFEQLDSLTAEFPDGTPMYADQVILQYSWVDRFNRQRTALDVYPAAGGKKPYFVTYEDTPFPGVGRAKGIWKRISARASQFSGTAVYSVYLEPGYQIALSAPGQPDFLGYVDASTHDLFAGTTQFRTKQTVAYTALSWFTAAGTWASQTGSWADEA